jgi:5-methylcytosine-specific restriction endonuclease McrA
VAKLLTELEHAQVICSFAVGQKKYGAVRNFCKWQRPKQPQYLHPSNEDIEAFVGYREAIDRPERGTALAKMLCDAQSGRCYYCDAEITFYRKKSNSCEIDHKIPVSRGGEDAVSNLVAACRPCNQLKRAMTEDEFRAKFASEDLLLRAENGVALPFRAAKATDPPPENCESELSQRAEKNSQDAKNANRSAKEEISQQREEGGDKKEREDSDLRSGAAVASPKELRSQIWQEGTAIVRVLTGKPDRSARTLLGRLLRDLHDDCAALLELLRQAELARPVDPEAWLSAAVCARGTTGTVDAVMARFGFADPPALQ